MPSMMITEIEQEPEEEKIKSLNILGYGKGNKRDLYNKLNAAFNKSVASSKKLLPKMEEKSAQLSNAGDSDASEKDDFDSKNIQYLKDILGSDSPPEFVYTPAPAVMRKLILRYI